jgi:O-antigen/teichoic acid export membrane protein
MERFRFAKEVLWIGTGHVVAVLGLLVGTRMLTEVISPETFGQIALVNAALALGQGLLYFPLGQAILRYMATVEGDQGESGFRSLLTTEYKRRFTLIAISCLPVAVASSMYLEGQSMYVFIIALATLAIEGIKTVELVLANAARRQVAYSCLLGIDGALRPISAAALAWAWKPSLEIVLIGNGLAAMIILGIYKIIIRKRRLNIHRAFKSVSKDVREEISKFSRVLIFTPILAWTSALADRYIVGALLGFAAVGIYSAGYAIASKPFLLLGAVSEATFRQSYYQAVSRSHGNEAKKVLSLWLCMNLGLGSLVLGLIAIFNNVLTSLVLAPEYFRASYLMPWIAGGHLIFIVSQTYERVAFAKGKTNQVVRIQTSCALFAMLCATAGAIYGGINGVAILVPLYYSAQALAMRAVSGIGNS